MGPAANAKNVNAAEDEAVVIEPAADMPARGEPSIEGGPAGGHSDDNDSELLDEAGYGYGV